MSSQGYNQGQQGYVQPLSPIGVTRAGRLDENPFVSGRPTSDQSAASPYFQGSTQAPSNIGNDPMAVGYAPMQEGLGSGMGLPARGPLGPSSRADNVYEAARQDNASTPSAEGTWTSSAADQSRDQGVNGSRFPGPIQTGRPADSGVGSQGTFTSRAANQAAAEEQRMQRPDYSRFEREAEQTIARSPRYATPPRSPRAGGIGDFGTRSPNLPGLTIPRSPHAQGIENRPSNPQPPPGFGPTAGGTGEYKTPFPASILPASIPRSPRAGGYGDYMDLPQGPLRSPRASSTGNFSSGTGLRSPQAGGVGDYGGRSRSPAPDYRRYERQAEEMIAKSPRYATPPRGRFGDQSPPLQASAYQAGSQEVKPLLGGSDSSAPLNSSSGVGGTKDFGAALAPLASTGTGGSGQQGSSGQGVLGTAQQYGQGAAQRVADAARSATDTAKEYTGYGQQGPRSSSVTDGSTRSYSPLEAGDDYTGSRTAADASQSAADASRAAQMSAQGTAQEIKNLLGANGTSQGDSQRSSYSSGPTYGSGATYGTDRRDDRTYTQAAADTASQAAQSTKSAAAYAADTVKEYTGLGQPGTGTSSYSRTSPSGYTSSQVPDNRTYTQAAADTASQAAQSTRNAAVSAADTVKKYTGLGQPSTGTSSYRSTSPSGYTSSQGKGNRAYSQDTLTGTTNQAKSDLTGSARTGTPVNGAVNAQGERTYTQAAADTASQAAQSTKNAAASAADTVKEYTGLGTGTTSTRSGPYNTSTGAAGQSDRTYGQAAQDTASQAGQSVRNTVDSAKQSLNGQSSSTTGSGYNGSGSGYDSGTGFGSVPGYGTGADRGLAGAGGGRTYSQAADQQTGKTSEFLAQNADDTQDALTGTTNQAKSDLTGSATTGTPVTGAVNAQGERTYTQAAADYASGTAQAAKNTGAAAVDSVKGYTGTRGEGPAGILPQGQTSGYTGSGTSSTAVNAQGERTYTQAASDAIGSAAQTAKNAAASAGDSISQATGAGQKPRAYNADGDRTYGQAAADSANQAARSTRDTVNEYTGAGQQPRSYNADGDRTYTQAAADAASSAAQSAKNAAATAVDTVKEYTGTGQATGPYTSTTERTYTGERTYTQAAADTASQAAQTARNAAAAAADTVKEYTGVGQGTAYQTQSGMPDDFGARTIDQTGRSSVAATGSPTGAHPHQRTYTEALADAAAAAAQTAKNAAATAVETVKEYTGAAADKAQDTTADARTSGRTTEAIKHDASSFISLS